MTKEVVKVNDTSYDYVTKTFKTKSEQIRYLRLVCSVPRSEVSKMLNVRYQHVRNVEITPTKKK